MKLKTNVNLTKIMKNIEKDWSEFLAEVSEKLTCFTSVTLLVYYPKAILSPINDHYTLTKATSLHFYACFGEK